MDTKSYLYCGHTQRDLWYLILETPKGDPITMVPISHSTLARLRRDGVPEKPVRNHG